MTKLVLLENKRHIRHHMSMTLSQNMAMRRMAKRQGIKMNELIVRAVDAYLEAHRPRPRNALVELPKKPVGLPKCPRCGQELSLNQRMTLLQSKDWWDCTSQLCKWQGPTIYAIQEGEEDGD